ncbi:tegument protein [Harp seal herpesvirus]|uniref:Tegument protein n=1 Tax=phocid gammaherpesvirus 3 TaxID=2560643 RepID=A0A0R5WUP9_9GAMA|nr:tegument protein [Harp seal herpesvirus]AJG42994.1 tegument protein [Harp seal herpesvirus]
MNTGRRLVSELCQVVTSFLCQPGISIDVSSCHIGPRVFSKGGTQPICTVKLQHGHIYNVEFVYRYWHHILRSQKYPLSPVFIISNNGLAVTLRCFVCEPKDIYSQFGNCQRIDSDVYLPKNSNVILSQDDFLKFKTNLVFSKDLNVCNSMVVCRTYLTENRQALQFLVIKPNNPKRVSAILHTIMSIVGISEKPIKPGKEKELTHNSSEKHFTADVVRKSIHSPEKQKPELEDKKQLFVDYQSNTPQAPTVVSIPSMLSWHMTVVYKKIIMFLILFGLLATVLFSWRTR